MKCRFCGFRMWPWQHRVDVSGSPVHRSCYSTSMHVLYVGYNALISHDKIIFTKNLLAKSWNTGQWLLDDWQRGQLKVDKDIRMEEVIPDALRVGKGRGRDTETQIGIDDEPERLEEDIERWKEDHY